MKLNTNRLVSTSLLITVALSFSACVKQPASTPTKTTQVETRNKQNTSKRIQNEAKKNSAYKNAMRKVGAIIKEDMNYKKLNLNTAQLKNWFTDITYKVWDHQISKRQFIALGLQKFPNHSYEFNLIANGLLRN